MKKLLNLLRKYEKKHAPRLFPSGSVRFTHWYRLNLYSDGSGYVQDTCGCSKDNQQVLFRFNDIKELELELNK
jgi:hypothetical protein